MFNEGDNGHNHDSGDEVKYIEKSCECSACNKSLLAGKVLPGYIISNKLAEYERDIIERGGCIIGEIKSFVRAVAYNNHEAAVKYMQKFPQTAAGKQLLIEFMKIRYTPKKNVVALSLFSIVLLNGKSDDVADLPFKVFKSIIQVLSKCYPGKQMRFSDIKSLCMPEEKFTENITCLLEYAFGKFENDCGVNPYFDKWLFDSGVLNIEYINELIKVLKKIPTFNEYVLFAYLQKIDYLSPKKYSQKEFLRFYTTISYKKKRLERYKQILERKAKKQAPAAPLGVVTDEGDIQDLLSLLMQEEHQRDAPKGESSTKIKACCKKKNKPQVSESPLDCEKSEHDLDSVLSLHNYSNDDSGSESDPDSDSEFGFLVLSYANRKQKEAKEKNNRLLNRGCRDLSNQKSGDAVVVLASPVKTIPKKMEKNKFSKAEEATSNLPVSRYNIAGESKSMRQDKATKTAVLKLCSPITNGEYQKQIKDVRELLASPLKATSEVIEIKNMENDPRVLTSLTKENKNKTSVAITSKVLIGNKAIQSFFMPRKNQNGLVVFGSPFHPPRFAENNKYTEERCKCDIFMLS